MMAKTLLCVILSSFLGRNGVMATWLMSLGLNVRTKSLDGFGLTTMAKTMPLCSTQNSSLKSQKRAWKSDANKFHKIWIQIWKQKTQATTWHRWSWPKHPNRKLYCYPLCQHRQSKKRSLNDANWRSWRKPSLTRRWPTQVTTQRNHLEPKRPPFLINLCMRLKLWN